uniref:Uncharacterized protein n=1 Tax=Anguilla anguilla TaxID=7936 RepID=A0A0E9UH83_ANGAN
MSWNHRREW